MKDDLETIAKAIELARLKVANLRDKYPDDCEKREAIDDADQGLAWVAKKLELLKTEK